MIFKTYMSVVVCFA